MKQLLIQPPVAFIIIFLFSLLASAVSSRLSLKSTSTNPDKRKPYACGEDFQHPRVQPGYAEFFSFAFFFTLMHVLAMMITTVPRIFYTLPGNAMLYLLCAVSGLLILFRRYK